MASEVERTRAALEKHMADYRGQILGGGVAGETFDALYADWIGARWDEKDVWVRSVWRERPLRPVA